MNIDIGIKRLDDGSIDYSHYQKRARTLRSEAMLGWVKRAMFRDEIARELLNDAEGCRIAPPTRA